MQLIADHLHFPAATNMLVWKGAFQKPTQWSSTTRKVRTNFCFVSAFLYFALLGIFNFDSKYFYFYCCIVYRSEKVTEQQKNSCVVVNILTLRCLTIDKYLILFYYGLVSWATCHRFRGLF